MKTKALTDKIKLNLQPSYSLVSLLIAIHCGALLSLITLQLSLVLKIFGILIVVYSAYREIFNQICITQHPLNGKYIVYDEIILEKIRQKPILFAKINASSYSYPFFVILKTQVISTNKPLSVIIFADSFTKTEYHRLRIRIHHLQRNRGTV